MVNGGETAAWWPSVAAWRCLGGSVDRKSGMSLLHVRPVFRVEHLPGYTASMLSRQLLLHEGLGIPRRAQDLAVGDLLYPLPEWTDRRWYRWVNPLGVYRDPEDGRVNAVVPLYGQTVPPSLPLLEDRPFVLPSSRLGFF